MFILELNQIYLGDCLDIMKEIDDDTIDLTVTSPPYDNLRTYNDSLNWNFEVFNPIADELYRITKPSGVVVWVVGDATIKGSETGSSFRQALYFKDIGFNLHDTMIWNKNSFSAVGALKTRYAPVFEYMFIFSKGKIKTFNPIKDKANKTAGQLADGTIRIANGEMKKRSSSKFVPKFSQRNNIWDLPPYRGRCGHPAPFPEQLAHDHIISWSNECDIVFDPFAGSGTTCKMAMLAGRDYIGIEKDEGYYELAKNRVLQASNTNVPTDE